jgi:hypothetical protein
MPGTFKAYVDNIEAKPGKTLDEFWRLAGEKGFVKDGKIAANHSEIVNWLKSQEKLGHIYSSFIATYIRLRAHDSTCTKNSKRGLSKVNTYSSPRDRNWEHPSA